MENINTNGLPAELCKEAIGTYEAIKDKFPSVRDFDKNPEKLLNLQGENADIIGALFKNSIGEADYVCRNGRAIVQCANAINKVNTKACIGIVLGVGAIALGYYCWCKIQNCQNRVRQLEDRVAKLEATGKRYL